MALRFLKWCERYSERLQSEHIDLNEAKFLPTWASHTSTPLVVSAACEGGSAKAKTGRFNRGDWRMNAQDSRKSRIDSTWSNMIMKSTVYEFDISLEHQKRASTNPFPFAHCKSCIGNPIVFLDLLTLKLKLKFCIDNCEHLFRHHIGISFFLSFCFSHFPWICNWNRHQQSWFFTLSLMDVHFTKNALVGRSIGLMSLAALVLCPTLRTKIE